MNHLGYAHFNDFCKYITCFILMVVYILIFDRTSMVCRGPPGIPLVRPLDEYSHICEYPCHYVLFFVKK
jgi:hypothetical protein